MMTELRVYLPIYDLQPQFAAYLSTPTRARGYPPFEGQHSLIIEVSPALAIHRISDLALKAAPNMEPGILFTERQFGLLELHSSDREELDAAGDAILKGIGASASDADSGPVFAVVRDDACIVCLRSSKRGRACRTRYGSE